MIKIPDILQVITVLIALTALIFQIHSWRMEYKIHVRTVERTKKNNIISIMLILLMLMTSINLLYSWNIYSGIYAEKTNEKRRTSQMKQDYNTLKDNLSLNPDVNPVFAVKIEDFDLRIHTSIEEGSDNAVFASIWSYSPGKYILSETLEGQAVLETIKEQLNDVLDVTKKQLDKMNKEDNIVFEVEAIGSADAIPYRRKVYYDGLLGDTLYNVRYYRFNEPDNPLYITFIKNETLMSNEYLALLRAYDAVKSLCHGYYIDNVKIFTREFDKTGPEYRRLDLQITLRNAFLEDYNELSFGSRLFKKIFK